MSARRDLEIPGPVTLAVTDYGGTGPLLVLLHGANRTRADWEPVVGSIGAGRVVAVDLPGHGGSAQPDQWTFALVNECIDAVTGAFDNRPVVVAGHSLGGMAAALYGASRPGCAGAVNLDGFGPGRPELYEGKTREEVQAHQQTTMAAAAQNLAQQQAASAEAGRPPMIVLAHIVQAAATTDMFEVYRTTTTPTIVVSCTRRPGGADPDVDEFQSAYRRGLMRELSAAAAANANFEPREMDATHGILGEIPDVVGRTLAEFVKRVS